MQRQHKSQMVVKIWSGSTASTEVAFALLTLLPWARIPALPRLYLMLSSLTVYRTHLGEVQGILQNQLAAKSWAKYYKKIDQALHLLGTSNKLQRCGMIWMCCFKLETVTMNGTASYRGASENNEPIINYHYWQWCQNKSDLQSRNLD